MTDRPPREWHVMVHDDDIVCVVPDDYEPSDGFTVVHVREVMPGERDWYLILAPTRAVYGVRETERRAREAVDALNADGKGYTYVHVREVLPKEADDGKGPVELPT